MRRSSQRRLRQPGRSLSLSTTGFSVVFVLFRRPLELASRMNGLREKFCHSHDLKLHFVVSQGGKAEGNLPKLRLKKLHVEPWSERERVEGCLWPWEFQRCESFSKHLETLNCLFKILSGCIGELLVCICKCLVQIEMHQ